MGEVLELLTEEARFFQDPSRDGHFGIDCSCKGKGGSYHGSHFKNTDGKFEQSVKNYVPLIPETKFKHTFYLREEILLNRLFWDHREKEGKRPLIIICNDCQREFPFTHESYLGLIKELISGYNRRIKKEGENKTQT